MKKALLAALSVLSMTVAAQNTVNVNIPQSVYSLYETAQTGQDPADRPSYQRSRNNMELYPVHADALSQGNPKGVVTEGSFTSEKVYPGVSYKYWVYVPAQYDGSKPANFIVFQDGGSYLSNDKDVDVPTVLDNLIAKGDIPVTIALMIAPGDKGPGLPIYGGQGNRSIEYDSVDDVYAQFLIDELMPATVGKYNISTKPEDNCIYGISSSGNSALAVAWHRNDKFGAVLSASGSFVNIRGGHVWPFAIRSHAKKAIKLFLTVGELDLNIVFGDWLTANYDVAKALEYRGYDYMLAVHKSGHNGNIMHYMLPDALRWLWKGTSYMPDNCEVIKPAN